MLLLIEGKQVECCEEPVEKTGIAPGQLFIARGREDRLLTCRETDSHIFDAKTVKFVFAEETAYVYDARNVFKVIVIDGENM